MRPTFFKTPEDFRAWLEQNHEKETELYVGFHKKGSGKPSMTWSEAVDQALCFGWIDGRVNRIDDERYTHRFTPRKPDSNWSKVNIEKVAKLEEQGLMRSAGRAAFERRKDDRSGIYSFEREEAAKLDPQQEKRFRANERAWEWFRGQAPWYRRTAIHWVVSAKREETREQRLATLIEDSEHGRTIKQLTRKK